MMMLFYLLIGLVDYYLIDIGLFSEGSRLLLVLYREVYVVESVGRG